MVLPHWLPIGTTSYYIHIENWVHINPFLKPITTYSTFVVKSSTCFSFVVSMGLTKGTCLDHGFSA